MNRRALLTGLAALAAAGCRRGTASRESVTPEEFSRRAKEIRGVTTVGTAGDGLTVGFNSALTADGLKALSDAVFTLVNSVELPGRPDITLVSGRISAQVGRTDVSGRPPMAPELRWVRWIDGTQPHRSLIIEERLARVSVDVDPMAWLRPLVARRPAVEKYSGLRVSHGQVDVSIGLGEPGAMAGFTALDRAVKDSAATLMSANLGSSSGVELRVRDRRHALTMVDHLLARCAHPADVRARLTTVSGDSWRGKLIEVRAVIDSSRGLARAVAATGANLASSGDYLVIEVPDGDVLEKVVALFASPAWTPGPESPVSISVRNGQNSNTTAEVWREAGPVLADALRVGLTSTRVTGGRGGTRNRRFDISFDQSDKLPDLTTPEGYGRIIDVLRRHRWQGEAQIGLSYDDHLIFWSTDTGRAQDAYFALHGAKSRKPTGWAVGFLTAWDASATS